MSERSNPFAEVELAQALVSKAPKKAIDMGVINDLAEKTGFPSRQPVKALPPTKRRRRVSDKTEKIFVTCSPKTKGEFDKIADQLNLPLGEVLERLIASYKDKT